MSQSTLIISEKSKAAQAIAEALGKPQVIKFGKFLKVYHIAAQNVYVVPLRGHIQQYENVGPYKKWSTCDPRQIITDPKAIAKIPNSYAGGYIGALKKYGKLCNQCVIGTDADVEGCNIGLFDALPFVTQVKPNIQIKQLWLNDLRKTTIQKGYSNLIPPKWSWGYTGEARAIIDAIIGFSATREVSLTLKPLLTKIDVKFTSIGRVQTSLLYLLYLREHLIRNFVPQPFWRLSAKIVIGDQIITANHKDNNFNEQKLADQIYVKIQHAKIATISDIKKNIRQIQPPTPLNTSKALLLLTKTLKIDSKLALKTMEELYLNKLITYPRTDSDVYAPDYDHLSLLQKFAVHNQYGKYIQDRLKNRKITPKQGKTNAGDHSPITPIAILEQNSSKFTNAIQWKAYDLISRSYLACFGDPVEESDTKIFFLIEQEPFIARETVLLKKGFLEIAPFLSKRYQNPLTGLPEFSPDMPQKPIVPVQKIIKEEKESQPPPRYSDTSLLKLMELKKLGTKSTRPAIIQVLLTRKYIERRKRYFYVKELGFLLIDALKLIWEPFLDPKFTAYVESELDAIKQGKKKMQDAVNGIKATFLSLFDKFRAQKPQFLAKMNTIKTTGNVIRGRENKILTKAKSGQPGQPGQSRKTNAPLTTAKCPKCQKSPMKLIVSKKKGSQFLVCADDTCKTFLSLPRKGKITILKSTCSICHFNVVKISVTKQGKSYSYYICPNCWNLGLKRQSGEGFCSNCKSFKIENGKCKKR